MADTLKDKLVVGMPAGSLADPKRGGNLVTLLEDAGFSTKGYDAGGPTRFPAASFLYGWDGRPQEFGSQLGIGELDVAIGGDDWITERLLEMRYEYNQDVKLTKALSLKRGTVRLVGITADETCKNNCEKLFRSLSGEKHITVVSELPYLALDWVKRRLKDYGLEAKFAQHSVQKYRTPPKIDSGVVVYETWGKTEAKVRNGGAHLGMEITQSGSALRNYGLSIAEEVMQSESGVWISPSIKERPEKLELLRMFLLNVHGTLNAEGKVLLLFNVARDCCPKVEEYLSEKNLYADEPSRSEGTRFTQYSIQVLTDSPGLPLARVRYDLAQLGAKNIDTVPLSSSIPNTEILETLGI